MAITRRRLIGGGVAAAAGIAPLRRLLADPGLAAALPRDALGGPDANGVRLSTGFTSRIIARSGQIVPGTEYEWHGLPDGGAVFAAPDGGWSYTSNSEERHGGGGVSSIYFDVDGGVVGAERILSGTTRNCAGGATPWGTWLSCEEIVGGLVFECDPFVPGSGVVRPALGAFRHEAAAVHPGTGMVFLTEDDPLGRLYRFVPDEIGRVDAGRLEAASLEIPSADVGPNESVRVSWVTVSPDDADRTPATSGFDGGEGAWIDGERLLFTTKGDCRIWQLDVRNNAIEMLYDCPSNPEAPLDDVDNIVVHQGTGDIYVAEDSGDMQLCVIRELADGTLSVTAFLQVVGQDNSEITGPAFSPDGQILYFSSQRGTDGSGIIYEVRGPFPRPRPDLAPSGQLAPAVRVGVSSDG